MKAIKAFSFLIIALASLVLTAPSAQAQNMLAVTKITSSSTTGGNVLFETAGTLNNALALSMAKSNLYVRTYGFTGGSIWIQERGTGKTIFRGPVSAITFVPTVASDSLKILWSRQNFTNAN